jgi:hypothetical protein
LRRVLILSTVLIAACAASGAAVAQSGPETEATQTATGLRYLSWPGKPAVARAPTLRRIAPQPAPTAALDAPRPRNVARLDAPAAATTTTRRGLTPASDWAPAPRSVSAASPTLQPYVPLRDVAADAPTQPIRAERAPPPVPSPVPNALPEQVLVDAQGQAEATPPAPVSDPMAPRRDAPIFRLQAQATSEASRPPTPVTPPSSPAPAAHIATQIAVQPEIVQAALSPAPVLGARFYSVHRQAGRKPDPIAAVQPVYLDALPVEMTQTPSSADLAQPDGPPALLRNSDGTVRAAPQTQEDALP